MKKTRPTISLPDSSLFAIAVVLGALAILELSLRHVEDKLSGNVAHVAEIDSLARQLNASQGTRVLFLGNSLTNNGIDLDRFVGLAKSSIAGSVSATKLVPDGTTIWSWRCILENHFLANQQPPLTIVVGFAWDQLSDQARFSPSELGAFYCRASDLLWISKHHKLTSAQVSEFFAAKTFRLFAHRETIRNRLLNSLIPNYESETQELNRRGTRNGRSLPPKTLEYTLLTSTIDRLRDYYLNAVLVAMPVRDDEYRLDPDLVELVGQERTHLIDYRILTGINPDLFLDSMHLSSRGAHIVTDQLAFDLVPLVQAGKSEE